MQNLMSVPVIILASLSITSIAVSDPLKPITLPEVFSRVAQHNPELQLEKYAIQAARSDVDAAANTLPYRIKVDVENIGGTAAGVQQENGLSLLKTWERGDKPELRTQEARGELKQRLYTFNLKQLDVMAQASERFLHVVVDQARMAIARDKYELNQQNQDLVKQRMQLGRSAHAELSRVKISLARAELELEHAEHELESSRMELASSWGGAQADYGIAQANLFNLPAVSHFSELEKQLEASPQLLQLLNQKQLARTRIRLARARTYGDIEFSAGMKQFSDRDDTVYMFSASLPLGTTSRAEPYIQSAQYHAEQTPFRHQARRIELRSLLFKVYQELKHAHTGVQSLKNFILPEAEKMLRAYEKGYRAGRYSLLELIQAQETLLNARQEAIMAAASYHRYRIEIERLTGTGLPVNGIGEEK